MSRVLRHLVLALAGCAVAAALALGLDGRPAAFRISMGTAYASLIYLSVTLALGPIYALTRRRRPRSTYLRRDIAIWAGALALVHVIAGLQVHFVGRMWAYFFATDGGGLALRLDPFGLTNYLGLVATVAIIVLLTVSNDASMRALGVERWSGIQSVAVWIGAITLAHAGIYQALERRSLAFIAFTLAAGLAVAGLRWARAVAPSNR